MKIGELAALTGTAVETIRYYEREGLMPAAPRTDSNYRLYGVAHTERLAFIRQCRSLDMPLDAVRVLLRLRDRPDADCHTADGLLDAHIDHVTTRLRELKRLKTTLQTLRAACHQAGNTASCGILSGLARPPRSPHGSRRVRR